jgi:hypothetical protein
VKLLTGDGPQSLNVRFERFFTIIRSTRQWLLEQEMLEHPQQSESATSNLHRAMRGNAMSNSQLSPGARALAAAQQVVRAEIETRLFDLQGYLLYQSNVSFILDIPVQNSSFLLNERFTDGMEQPAPFHRGDVNCKRCWASPASRIRSYNELL